MPNRTINLPDDVDAMARELDINLSKVTQDAVRSLAAERAEPDADFEERLARARRLAAETDIRFPPNYLRDSRREAGDDLR